MPQLDKITFLSQFFWLSFFYLGFYFLIYKYFLPKMSRTLKFRKRRMNTSQEGVTSMGEESDKVVNSYQTLLSTGLTTCRSVFNQNFKGAEEWLNSTVSQANQRILKNTNQRYISSLGERSISQRLVISQAFVDISEKTTFALLITKLKSFKKNTLAQNSTIALNKNSQGKENLLKDNKAEKAPTKSAVVDKKENKGKNKIKQNKEQEQIVDKDLSAKEKNSRTASPKCSTAKGSKTKSSKKKLNLLLTFRDFYFLQKKNKKNKRTLFYLWYGQEKRVTKTTYKN